jgi:hypothetical protein
MAYANRGLIVIIAKRVLSNLRSRFPNTARVPDLARNVQCNNPLSHLRVFLTDRRAYRHVLPCGMRARHPGSFQDDLSAALFSYTHGHLKAEVSYSMVQEIGFQASHSLADLPSDPSSRFVRRSQSADLPDYRQLVPNLYRTRSL